MATNLLEEYKESLTEFRFMLIVTSAFTVDGIIRRQETAKTLADEEIQKGKEKLLQKLLGEERQGLKHTEKGF